MKKTGKGNLKEEIPEKEAELQAIILADNFSTKFSPITLKTTKVLII